MSRRRRGLRAGGPWLNCCGSRSLRCAIVAAALGYGVMNLLMAATPIAMQQCQHPFESAALVLEWHVLGMFVPSFFTGHLIKRFGVLPVMLVGALLNLVCVAVALVGCGLMEFLVALFALGVGWNFLYTGGTTLFTQCYRPEEKNRAQGVMDSCVFGTMALSSFSSGALITTQGWRWLNLGSLVPIVLVMAALLWLAAQRARRAQLSESRAFPAGRSVLPATRRRSRSRLLRRGVCGA
jgi:MFS family permease